MRIDEFEKNINELMPNNYMFKIHCFSGQNTNTTIYRDNEKVDSATHESMPFAFNHILQYFKLLQTLKK